MFSEYCPSVLYIIYLVVGVFYLSRCRCGYCIAMPTSKERRCCHSYSKITAKLGGLTCISRHPDFKTNCLVETVLQVDEDKMVENDGPVDDMWSKDQ